MAMENPDCMSTPRFRASGDFPGRSRPLPSQLDDAGAIAALQHASPLSRGWLGGLREGNRLLKLDDRDGANPTPASMSLDMLRSFVKLGEVCNFSSSAAQLGITQPTLTKQIQRLEDLLGEKLFSRSRQGTTLTTFGERFLREIAPAIRDMGRIWKSGVRIARGETKRLSLGCTPSAIDVMTRAISAYRYAQPDVQLDIHVLTSELQMRMLREKQLSLAFARWPGLHDLEGRLIAEDRLTFIYPKSMAGTISSIDSSAVRDMPFIRLERTIAPGFEGFVDRLLGSKSITPAFTHQVNDSLVQLRLVAAGMGVAVMHDSGLKGVVNSDAVGMETIDHPRMAWQVGLFWHRNEIDPAILELVELVIETYAGSRS